VEGGEIKAAPEAPTQAKVIDLMEALKASLARKGEEGKAEKKEKGRAERPRTPERRRAPLRKAG
jgi:non-homologous end joining protein Ku